MDNKKQRVFSLWAGQGYGEPPGAGMTQGGARALAPAPRGCIGGLQTSGRVKAGFLLPPAAPKSRPTQVWGKPGKMRLGRLGARHPSSVLAWEREAPTWATVREGFPESVVLEMDAEGD